MKKLLLISVLAMFTVSLIGQDLETIIKKHEKAIGFEAMQKTESIKISAVTSTMGMEIFMTMYEKQPDKNRIEMDFNGMQMITVVNGDKGYMINPMMGSSEPVAISGAELASAKNQKVLGSGFSEALKENRVELIGESEFEGKAVYKLKMETEAGPAYAYIDKSDYLVLGMELEMTQMGQTITAMVKMMDYKEVNGFMLAHKMINSAM
ncbi:MAG: hypothetical protein R3356_07505, partial [Eudoraea sp.]|nr:hypothetical protein [Eudoraea sp.]